MPGKLSHLHERLGNLVIAAKIRYGAFPNSKTTFIQMELKSKIIIILKFHPLDNEYLEICVASLQGGRGGQVVRCRSLSRRVPGSKPDSTGDPSYIGPVSR
ncbi:hypothetical protein AVEN_45629-1 [Araneus ventricosus]|uniref:Uncharacterized protein n=1 Tax=Araneus ventricosus TaxID=182803 RepID=A0A4Y2EUW6_ARAVE|nr:hypothetical protein AVEN_45629-1 [Araneus ventricosus]